MDARSDLDRALWEKIGPPLYYCAECLLRVSVEARPGSEPLITRDRRCTHEGEIIAPRRATLVGQGGMSVVTKARVKARQAAARVTGRDV